MEENGPLCIMGDVEGENEKLDWKWAVEPMTPSLSMKVSRLKAWLLVICCCRDDRALELSREYPLSSGSFSKSRVRADELGLTALI